jgi:hypothetical protein
VTIPVRERRQGARSGQVERADNVDSVPLVAAAVCPHPPMLVPEVAAGAAGELDSLRSACDVAVAALSDADFIVVVGTDDRSPPEDPRLNCRPSAGRLSRPKHCFSARYEAPVGGSLAPWGLPMTVGEPSGSLPLSLLIGRWLAPRADSYVSIAAGASPQECAELGASLVEPGRVGLLIMGDGSACRTEKAPGYLDQRAEPFDLGVARALADADAAALLAIDPGLAAELLAAGRAPWQVLAGARGPETAGELLFHEAPYGVGYLVAAWR